MKYLILLRHAKSSWKDMSLSDHDRPLNKRGKYAATLMGKRLNNKAIHPQKIISSSANRALKTAHLVAQQINYPTINIEFNRNIYLASAKEVLTIIAQTSDDIDKLMLVAHNPGITSLCNQLLKSSHHYFENIPTAGLVTISIAVNNWMQIAASSVTQINIKLIDYDYPKLVT
ncbi:MAG: histidine phosphatase family protein [Alcanivoracaceae bacterium]|nr:histidine phosphatase family protein [Alcanivoracaceae bacterium]